MKLYKKKSEVEYYSSCDDLWYYNFYRILETRNYAYLIKGWDEVSEIQYNKDKAFKVWQKIYSEYTRLKDDNKLLMHIEVCAELMYLENRKYVVMTLAEIMGAGEKTMDVLKLYADEIKEWGFSFNLNLPLDKELHRLQRQMLRVDNKIGILQDQKEDFEEEQGEEITLMAIIVAMEQALNRDEIDPKKIVVTKWIAMVDKIKQIAKHRKAG